MVMPSLREVLIFNDDVTTMEFVVNLLADLFGESRDDAIRLMLKIHEEGQASCGAYPPDEARRLAEAGKNHAAQAGFPLRLDVVEAGGGSSHGR